jgi:hypothetical protein
MRNILALKLNPSFFVLLIAIGLTSCYSRTYVNYFHEPATFGSEVEKPDTIAISPMYSSHGVSLVPHVYFDSLLMYSIPNVVFLRSDSTKYRLEQHEIYVVPPATPIPIQKEIRTALGMRYFLNTYVMRWETPKVDEKKEVILIFELYDLEKTELIWTSKSKVVTSVYNYAEDGVDRYAAPSSWMAYKKLIEKEVKKNLIPLLVDNSIQHK